LASFIIAGFLSDKLYSISEDRFDTASRMALPAAASRRKLDLRRPIVYLRPFKNDDSWIDTEPVTFRDLILHRALGAKHFESSLIDHLARYGPPVAIANQRGELPIGGAARLFAEQGEWQDKVRGLLTEAELIVVMLGRDAGIAWELEQIVSGGF